MIASLKLTAKKLKNQAELAPKALHPLIFRRFLAVLVLGRVGCRFPRCLLISKRCFIELNMLGPFSFQGGLGS